MEAGDQDSTGAGVAVPFEQAVSRTLELPLPRPRPRQPPLQQLTARSVVIGTREGGSCSLTPAATPILSMSTAATVAEL